MRRENADAAWLVSLHRLRLEPRLAARQTLCASDTHGSGAVLVPATDFWQR
jgi:hypothetical protein